MKRSGSTRRAPSVLAKIRYCGFDAGLVPSERTDRLDGKGVGRCLELLHERPSAVGGRLRVEQDRRPADLGLDLLRSSTHFPANEGSKLAKPVTLPPGRDRLPIRPFPTGSAIPKKRTGMVRVSARTATVAGVPFVTMRLGCASTSSLAMFVRSAGVVGTRRSTCTVSAPDPTQGLQLPRDFAPVVRVHSCDECVDPANPPHPTCRLGRDVRRPRQDCRAEQPKDVAPSHTSASR